MIQEVDVAVIGAGSAGISAFKEAQKYSKKVLLIDHGPLGTTCARVGCMPSKVWIHVANLFYQRKTMSQCGIHGGDHLAVSIPEVMQYVRKLRDQFAGGMVAYTEGLGDAFLNEKAYFIEPNLLQVGESKLKCKKVVIATGSVPNIPDAWRAFEDKIITSDNFFEQKDLPKEMAVIGAGIIGLELGQALARLGVKIKMFHASEMLAILSDPEVNKIATAIFKKEFDLYVNERAEVSEKDDLLNIKSGSCSFQTKKILAAMGRKPNLDSLQLRQAGIEIPDNKIPAHQLGTMQLDDLPIFIAGDANQNRPLLHEAIDEGRIAGYNATHDPMHCFKHRTPLAIVFTQPNIAVIGKAYSTLDLNEVVIGAIDYRDQGRAKIMGANQGIMRVYADRITGLILGAEMIAPGGEHMAHQLAWAIEKKITVHEALQMPFYHPVLEEGMRTALRDAAKQVQQQPESGFELAMCDRGVGRLD